ncbi:hypothetical protein N425_04805 [Tannerella sp. oral taxon BU063 isolate Cell 2]|uniref:Uncharacterized protein n=1 Tax=Tannerella sp. oral taxon BU063 isolate Cell 2 TaxID=1411148 RepID=W2C5F4_9BACT|nr:hypothetical protein N425_04805 [Tannerella sp. oral taxon BU063 isolate Cell 2]
MIFIIVFGNIEYLHELFIIISDNDSLRGVKSPRARDSVIFEGSESFIDRDRKGFPRAEPLYV